MNRDRMREAMGRARDAGLLPDERLAEVDGPADDGNPLGTPEAEIQWAVDITEAVDAKREALACHASQVTDIGMFLAIPRDLFAEVFGVEYYLEPGRPAGMRRAWPFD